MAEGDQVDRFTHAEIVASIGDAVIVTDVAGIVAYWNPAAERLYGWTATEAIGRNIGELTVPDVTQQVAEDIMDALRRGVRWSGGFPVRRRDGTIFPALVTDAGIYRDNELIGIVGISSNLGSALQPLLERSTDAAMVLRSDAVITYASPAVHELFGWREHELVGTSGVALIHPDDRGALAEYLTRVVAKPGPHPAMELRVHRGEEWVWAEAALTNLLDDPVVRGVVCNLRLSVRRAAQEAAELRAAQLETALQTRVVIEQAKGFLLAHDGDTPDHAFDRMRLYARAHNMAIREVATRVLAGELVPPSHCR